MGDTLIAYLSNLIVNELKKRAKQYFENYKSERELFKSIDDFQNELKNWIQEFIGQNEASIIETTEFTNYIKHYNFIEHIIEYLTEPSSMIEDEETFLKQKNDNIIKYLYENKKIVTPTDRGVINEFINYIFNSVKHYILSKLSEEQKLFYHTNQNILKQNQDAEKKLSLSKKKYFVDSDLIERKVISYDHIQDLDLYYNLNERKNLYDVCQKEHYVILLGDAGCGKTTSLKQTAHYVCNKYYTLFISLSDYTGEEINNLICSEYQEYENLSLFIIFDAFDEINEKDRYTFARKLNSFVERHKNAIVLVSARNNFYKFADENGEGSTLKQFKEYALCPLTQNDIIVYSENKGIDYNNFNRELYHHRLHSIVYNPFYLNILVELMKENSHLPSKKELMDEIIKNSFKFDKKNMSIPLL